MEQYAQVEHDGGWIRKTTLQLADRPTITSIGDTVKVNVWIAKRKQSQEGSDAEQYVWEFIYQQSDADTPDSIGTLGKPMLRSR